MRLSANKALTLIELLIACSILSFIAVGIYSSLSVGMRIFRRVSNTDMRNLNRLLGLEKISRDLRQSLNYPQVGFTAEQYEFSFPALSGDSTLKIIYRIDRHNKKIWRGSMDLAEAAQGAQNRSYSEKELFSFDELAIKYYCYNTSLRGFGWSDYCIPEDGPFKALRLQLKIEDEGSVKTLFIPWAL